MHPHITHALYIKKLPKSDEILMTTNLHIKAALQALFVTFLWSTSWMLIKIGLQTSLPAITFAGLRYFIAFLCLIPFILINPTHRKVLHTFSRATWGQLVLLGIVFYALTQGAQFVSLAYLPAATLSLLLNFSPVFVALSSGFLQDESPSIIQWGGIILSVVGAIVYFLPLNIPTGQVLGLMIALIGVLANSGSSLLGRRVNYQSGLAPILVTAISMGIGGLLLLIIGAMTQGFGKLNLMQWLIIGWLAVVNTAVAFTLWNNTLKTLTAVESSVINSTMLPQIAILAWLILDEPLNPRQIIGIVLVGIGTLIVQLWRRLPSVGKSVTVKLGPRPPTGTANR
jgi:drug/metabolite transporter (DMT)-like permease